MEQYDIPLLKKLSGLSEDVAERQTLYILEEPDEDELPVQDGDNDGTGYKYDADTYNTFGDEDQQFKYVPARYADNPLKDPVNEQKTFMDYMAEAELKAEIKTNNKRKRAKKNVK